ncbi:MFS transporter [Maribellus maritimus]|uniref:hypothetical protein n=1 Tax=Maribellus maritimus TaxID=2870838 RepID=UPI001EECCF02|nr:hypothetical protein [Maribellus maritimus]MCG6186708.1 hypothetical protein [Maribellus maritimus]
MSKKTTVSAGKKHSYLFPLIIVGIMFFAIVFALGINSYLVPLQNKALHISAATALAGSFLVVFTPAAISICFIFLMALGCSLMWPALWQLAMADLGKFTKAGSSLLVTAIAGGAVVPTLYGFLKDAVGAQNGYRTAVPCFLFIFYNAISGHKIRTSN